MPDPTPRDLLRKYRPVRYEHGDRAWQRPAIEAMRLLIEADPEVMRHLAGDRAEWLIDRQEEADTRAAHLFLRDVGRTGQWPLGLVLVDVGCCPLKIGRKEKFRLEVASTSDIERWELSRRRDHDTNTQRMLWETRGAQRLVEWMTGQGVATFGAIDWGQVPMPPPGTEVEPDLPDDDDEPE